MNQVNDASFLKVVETVDGKERDVTPKPQAPAETPAPADKDKKGGKP